MVTQASFSFGGSSPLIWARMQSEELRKSTRQLEPYVDLEPIKRLRRVIKPISYDEKSESEAQIVPIIEGFKIVIGANKKIYYNRQKITVYYCARNRPHLFLQP